MKYHVLKGEKKEDPINTSIISIFQVEEDQIQKNRKGFRGNTLMNVDKSFSNLSMSEKRKRLMAIVDMRKNTKRKKFELPSMLEKGEMVNSKKPINNKSTKKKKLNSHKYRKIFQNRGSKVKKVSQEAGDHITASEIDEYWVPVHLSHMQIEKYCSLLSSNLEVLSSSLRDNSLLNDILTQTQKCCDHPYLVDPTLRESLKRDAGVDQLDAEISVSGKLQLLDNLLLKIKLCNLRALVLFQSISTSKNVSIGDILDDLVDKRFGHDSYIRIHGKILSRIDRENRKKYVKMFNNVDTGKFVCLLDQRACHPSIRFSSIDVVILFNSDWNPLNDIKALRKLTLDSNRLRVLRLYSSFTIEEQALILSKQGTIYDGNTTRILYKNCHRLLAWGASYLLNKLSNDLKSKSKSKSETCFMDDLVHELSSLLLNKNGNSESLKSSIISNAKIHEGIYSENIQLLGESEEHMKESCSSLNENGSVMFWTNLLKESPSKNSCSRLSRRVQKSFRNSPNYLFEGEEPLNESDASPTVRKGLRSKRRVCSVEQSTNCDAECTNDQPQQPQTSPPPPPPVVPPVSDQSCIAAPLETELENINKEREKFKKLHEEKKSMLLSEREKEMLEISKKYDALIDESEICLTKKMNVLEEYYDLVYANKVLAETLTRTCDETFNEEKTEKESGEVKILEIPASALVQSEKRCTSGSSMPSLRAPAPHLRSSPSLFASSIPQTRTELNMDDVKNQENMEKLPVVQSSHSWHELLGEFDSFYDMGYPNLPFLDSN